jgi:hypothetical protein
MTKAKTVTKAAPAKKLAAISWTTVAALLMRAIYEGEQLWNKLTPEQQAQVIEFIKKLVGLKTPRLEAFVPPKKARKSS